MDHHFMIIILFPSIFISLHHTYYVVRTQTHKLIFRFDPTDPDHDSELYDLVSDPRELNNIYGTSEVAEIQQQLKQKLFMWMMMTSDVTPWNEDPRRGGWNGENVTGAAQYFADVALDTKPKSAYHVWHE